MRRYPDKSVYLSLIEVMRIEQKEIGDSVRRRRRGVRSTQRSVSDLVGSSLNDDSLTKAMKCKSAYLQADLCNVREIARQFNIAYGLARGRKYSQIEVNPKSLPNFDGVSRLCDQFGFYVMPIIENGEFVDVVAEFVDDDAKTPAFDIRLENPFSELLENWFKNPEIRRGTNASVS